MNIQSTIVYAVAALKRRFIRERAANSFVITNEVIDQAKAQFFPTIPDSIKSRLNGRFERGVNMAKGSAVSIHTDMYQPDKRRLFKVRSSSMQFSYLVDLDEGYCECPDHMKGHFCKHLIASSIIEIAMQSARNAPANTPGITPLHEDILWAVIRVEGACVGVEVLDIDGEMATVRALPKIVDGKKLQPQYPFLGGFSKIILPKKELSHLKAFRHV